MTRIVFCHAIEDDAPTERSYFRVAQRKIFVDIKTKVPQYLEQDAR
jgi:hypothetical protein